MSKTPGKNNPSTEGVNPHSWVAQYMHTHPLTWDRSMASIRLSIASFSSCFSLSILGCREGKVRCSMSWMKGSWIQRKYWEGNNGWGTLVCYAICDWFPCEHWGKHVTLRCTPKYLWYYSNQEKRIQRYTNIHIEKHFSTAPPLFQKASVFKDIFMVPVNKVST